MKKIIYLLLVSISLFSLFSACSDNQIVEEVSSNMDVISSTDNPLDTPLSNSSDISNSDDLEKKKINTPDFAFFMNFSTKPLIVNSFKAYQYDFPSSGLYLTTLSFITDGVDKAISNIDDYDLLSYNNFTELSTNVYAKDYYSQNSTSYDSIFDDTIIYSYIGNKNQLENKVTYINYLVDERYSAKEEWIKYFENIIFSHTQREDIPIIIQESFEFKINGLNAVAINAGNLDIFYDYEQIFKIDNNTDNLKPNSPFLRYRLSAVFIEGFEPILTFSDITVYDESWSWTPIEEGENFDYNTAYIYQEDINGTIKRFPYSSSVNTDNTSTTQIEYFIADIDNNGIEDILWQHDGQGNLYLLRNAISLDDKTVITKSLYPLVLEYSPINFS